MSKLINLGFVHIERNYKPAHDLLKKLNPNVITLELSVLQPIPYMGEVWLFEKGKSEFAAGYIFAKENNLPLYAIDSFERVYSSNLKEIQLNPKEVIKHNLTTLKNPLKLFPRYWDYFAPRKYSCERNSLQKRNEFMAQALDLLSQTYPKELIAHIGGANHVIPTNSEGATPIHRLTRRFDEVSGMVLCYDRALGEYFWIDRIDRKIRRRLVRGKISSPFLDYEPIKKKYIF